MTDTPTPTTTRRRSPLADAVAESPEGIVLTQMLIVADVERSVAFYRDVLGATVERDSAPAMLRLHNGWIVLNVGGGPTNDKPQVTVTPPADPNTASAFLNIRVADIHSIYNRWSQRGAEFLTEPMERGPEYRCYLQDPDGYLIEVGQTKDARASAAHM
jgi:catechol 2,3-dioxygenase-like lactoylglutathione lyase family enzyme